LDELNTSTDDFEVIVVDDCSTDDTNMNYESIEYTYRYRYVRHAKNKSAAAARNTGIEIAKGEVLLFLDDDMLAEPELLNEHLAIHDRIDSAAVMGNINIPMGMKVDGFAKYLSKRGVQKLEKDQAMPFYYWCSGNASVKKSTLLQVGSFDESIVVYGGEDLELAYRLSSVDSIVFVYASKAVSYHLCYQSLSHTTERMYTYGKKSLAYILQKHPSLKKVVKADLLDPIDMKKDSIPLLGLKVLYRVCNNELLYTFALRIALLLDAGSPALLYNYIIAYNYLRGLRKHLEDSEFRNE
jgi:glycosyltransferase involved in cell wall biosynthesis